MTGQDRRAAVVPHLDGVAIGNAAGLGHAVVRLRLDVPNLDDGVIGLGELVANPDGEGELLTRWAIVRAVDLKPERHHFDLSSEPQIVRFMNMTGG